MWTNKGFIYSEKFLREIRLMASELLMELYGDLLQEQVAEATEQLRKQAAEQVAEATEQVRKQATEQVAEAAKQVRKQAAKQVGKQERRLAAHFEKKEETLIVNMLREGIAPEVAVKITGLPFEKIRELTFKLAN
jgi:FKBP-type peptidyl-prolyl cis-trans isomerase